MSFGGRGRFSPGARGGRGGRSPGGRGGGGRIGPRDEGPPAEIVEAGCVAHDVESELLCQWQLADKVPYFNAGIYLENKRKIGKVDEILGKVNNIFVTIKMDPGILSSSFQPKDLLYIGTDKLLPISRFTSPGGSSGGRSGGGGRGRGRGPPGRGGRASGRGGSFGGRGGGGGRSMGRGGSFGGRGGRGGGRGGSFGGRGRF
jgi:H/ACA ribonucleoprotein complex subunit 1